MFKHEKQLFHPVAVERPNPQFAALLQRSITNMGHRPCHPQPKEESQK